MAPLRAFPLPALPPTCLVRRCTPFELRAPPLQRTRARYVGVPAWQGSAVARSRGAKVVHHPGSFEGRRSMFIEVHATPNINSLKFHPGRAVLKEGTADFPNARASMKSPLAKALFRIDGVSAVFFGPDFVTVTKTSDELSWGEMKPEIFSAMMDFFASGAEVLDEGAAQPADTLINDDDSEVVALIKELLDTRIRPAVQDDGGDISFIDFDEDSGVVTVQLQGACSTCSSSKVTLKSGVENMLMHYVPEVTEVVAMDSEEDENDPVIKAQKEFVESMTTKEAPPTNSAGNGAKGAKAEKEKKEKELRDMLEEVGV